MKKLLCMSLVFIMLCSSCVYAAQLSFPDVEGHWAEKEIYKMAEKWIILGKTNGTFGPNDNITKTHAFLMFSRLMGYYDEKNKEIVKEATLEYSQELNNADIKEGVSEVAFLIKTEVISIDDVIEILGNKKQNNELSRIEASYIFVKLLGCEGELNRFPLINFEDKEEITEEYKPYVEYVNKIGLMIGYDNKFNPNGYITRAQVATILCRISDILSKRGIQEKQGLITKIENEKIAVNINGKEEEYKINNKIKIYDNNIEKTKNDLKENDFIKMEIEDGIIKKIIIENVESILYATYSEIIIEDNKQYIVINKDEAILRYEILQNDLEILKENKSINIKDIIPKENIKLTLKNDKVWQIVVGEVKYNISGAIKQIVIGKDSFLTIQDLKGNINKYIILEDTIYDFDGAIGNIYDLRLNTDVILTINNKGIEKVKVETLTNIQIINGTVDRLLPKIYVFTIVLDDNQVMMMFLDEQETVIKTSSGIAKSIEDIKQGDNVSIYGRFEQDVFYPIQVIINI